MARNRIVIASLASLVVLSIHGSLAAPETSQTQLYTKPQVDVKPPVFQSVDAVLNHYGKPVRQKLEQLFVSQNVAYPPRTMTWIVLKEEKQLLLFAKDKNGAYKKVLSYPIIGASGVAGPKLKEGDKQVPEGFYKIEGFRPQLVAHIGMAVNYPNASDRSHAQAEKRKNLGCDILIHGSRWSTGCLAMGNEPIENLFVLAHDVGADKISLVFAPCNLTKSTPAVDFNKQPAWLHDLYRDLRAELARYPI